MFQNFEHRIAEISIRREYALFDPTFTKNNRNEKIIGTSLHYDCRQYAKQQQHTKLQLLTQTNQKLNLQTAMVNFRRSQTNTRSQQTIIK